MEDLPESEGGGNGIGGFFAVDARSWGVACGLGVNAAVAYLVLARGTGPDQATTRWSVAAIERYTGIPRLRAATAIKALEDYPLIAVEERGKRPKYRLLPAHKVLGTRAKKGADPDWIWLPNELVTGAASEIPPVELVRQGQDVMVLRLLVDLYHDHNLAEHGGVSPFVVRKQFKRSRIGQRGQYVAWGFRDDGLSAWRDGAVVPHAIPAENSHRGEWSADALWPRLNALQDLGLVEVVPFLFESDSKDAAPIHPLNMRAPEGSLEGQLARAAEDAGMVVVTEGQLDIAVRDGFDVIVPVPRHVANVALIGILRLLYRPRTRMTSAWQADLQEKTPGYLAKYREICESAAPTLLAAR